MPEHNREEIAKLEALYESNPEGRVFTHLAEAYRKAGDYERARSILEKGLEKHPSYASAHVVLGRVFADLNDMPQARASFRHVLDLDPHNLVALRSLGELARAAGNNEEALGYFEELRHQDPGNDEVDRIIDALKRAPPEAVSEAPPPETTIEPAPPEDAQVQGTFEEPSFAGDSKFETPAADVLEELPGFEDAQPDYGDLVSGDIDLGWTAGAETDAEVLPGDLGDLVSEAAGSAEPDAETAEESASEFETFDVSDLEYVEEEITYEVLESVELPAPEPPLWQQVQEPEAEEVLHSVFGEPAPAAADAGESPPDDLATETMAQLLVDQGLHEAAADVYRALIRERPWDPDLKNRLAEVEALGRASAPSPEQPEPEEHLGGATPPEPAEPETEPELESPWMGAPALTPSAAATPYAWTDEVAGAGDEEHGPPITEYFHALLAWRPGAASAPVAAPTTVEPEPEPEGANFEPTPETADQPAVVALEPPTGDEAAAADQLMPWEVPALPEQTPAPAPTAKRSENPVDAAFEEWFNASESESAEQTPASAPVQEAEGDGESEDDDDLEMFRSWLQSLKK